MAETKVTKNEMTVPGTCSYRNYLTGSNTTTSQAYVDVPNASATITTNGGPLLISVTMPLYVSVRTATGGIQINGVDYDIITTDSTVFAGSQTGHLVVTGIPAGTYTVKLRYHVQTAGDTAYLSTYDNISFSVVELR